MQTSMFTALIAAYRANRNRLKNHKRRKVSNPRRYACPPGLRSQHHDVVCHRRLPRRRDLLGLQRNGPGHLQKRYRANVQGQVRWACTSALLYPIWPCTSAFLLGLALYIQNFCSGWPCTSKVGPVPPRLALYLQHRCARVGPVHPEFCAGRPCTSMFLLGLALYIQNFVRVGPVPPSFCSGWPCTSNFLLGLALYIQVSARVGPVPPTFCSGRPCTSKVVLGLALYIQVSARVGPVHPRLGLTLY